MKIKYNTIIHIFIASSAIGVAISYSKLYFFHIMLLLLLAGFLFAKVKFGKFNMVRLPTNFHHMFYILFAWYFATILWSINIAYSLTYLFYLFCGASISLVLIYYANDLKKQLKIFNILAGIFIIEVIMSLAEAFSNFRLPISPFSPYVKYFGRSITYSEDNDIDVISILLNSPTGFEWNPNNLAIAMVIIFPFFLLASRKWIKLLGCLSILAIIVMTGSRGAFIALSLVIMLYLFFLNKKLFILTIIIIPISIGLISTNIDALKNSDNGRIREMASAFSVLSSYLTQNEGGSDSIGTRQQLIKNGINALVDSHYLGVGGGGSVAVQELAGKVNGKVTSMHNFWVEMLVDAGLGFTLIFIIWYITVVFKLYMISHNSRDETIKYHASATFLSMASFSIGAVSASSVIYFFPMWIMFGFSIAIINNHQKFKNETIVAK